MGFPTGWGWNGYGPQKIVRIQMALSFVSYEMQRCWNWILHSMSSTQNMRLMATREKESTVSSSTRLMVSCLIWGKGTLLWLFVQCPLPKGLTFGCIFVFQLRIYAIFSLSNALLIYDQQIFVPLKLDLGLKNVWYKGELRFTFGLCRRVSQDSM